MSANSVSAATKGPVFGGIFYILFAFVPMFLVASALIIMPEQTALLLKEDPQKILPTLVLQKMPFIMQVLFFGALLSAIKSTASATLLAPSVTFVENIWRQFKPRMSDKHELKLMRTTVLVFSGLVLTYAISMEGTSIYDMVSGAYQVPLWAPSCAGQAVLETCHHAGAIFAIVLRLGPAAVLATPWRGLRRSLPSAAALAHARGFAVPSGIGTATLSPYCRAEYCLLRRPLIEGFAFPSHLTSY